MIQRYVVIGLNNVYDLEQNITICDCVDSEIAMLIALALNQMNDKDKGK